MLFGKNAQEALTMNLINQARWRNVSFLFIVFFCMLWVKFLFSSGYAQNSNDHSAKENNNVRQMSWKNPVAYHVSQRSASGDLAVSIGQRLTHSFPLVDVYVSVTHSATSSSILGLPASSFHLAEDPTGEGDAFSNVAFTIESMKNIDPPLTIVIVVDRSGSMAGQAMIDAKEAVQDFVKYFTDNDYCGIVSFDGDVRVDAPLMQMVEEGRRTLHESINGISAAGSTALYDGLQQALDMHPETQSQAVIIAFADGDDNSSGHSRSGVIEYANQLSIPIHTIGIYNDITFEPDNLREIAEQTGGTYRGGSAAEMGALFAEINAAIQGQYRLSFTSTNPERTNNMRLIRVEVSHEDEMAFDQAPYWTEPPECDLGISEWAGSLGDPVNTGVGNFIHEDIDLRVNTRGLPLVFRRFYNSLDETIGLLGKGWTHNYNVRLAENDGGENRVSIRWEDGRKDYWLKDAANNLFTPINLGNRSELTLAAGTWTCQLKNLKRYEFFSDGRLNKIVDRNDNELTMTYADPPDTNRLMSVTHSLGKCLNFSYNANGRIESVSESLGDPAWINRLVSFSYSGNNLNQATDVMGKPILYEYDVQGRMISITDQRGVITLRNEYDDGGRVARQFDGKNNRVDFAYNTPSVNQTTVTRYLKEGSQTQEIKTVHIHDGIARLLEIVYPNEKTVEFTYSGNSNRDSIKDRNGNTRTFNYDLEGNVTAIRSPDSSVVRLKYNDIDLPISATDPLGYEIAWEYDPNGNLKKETRWQDKDKIQSITRSWDYNTYGQVLTAIDERIKTTSFTYDANGYLIQITDPAGTSTWFQYDAAGRRIGMTDARGSGPGDPNHTTTFTYDKAGRLTHVYSPVGELDYEYDAAGNQTRAVNARGKTTIYEYDKNGALIAIQRPGGANTFYDFDSLNRLRQSRRANETGEQITRYTYDDLDRVAAATRILENGDTLRTDYAYDAHGNALSVVSPSGVAVFGEYDSMNRLTAIRDELGNVRRMAFDIRGLQSSVIDARGNRTDYYYDALRRLIGVGEPQPDGGDTAYTYDPAGNLETIDDARPGSSVVMQRNYDDRGMLDQETDGDGFSHEYSYDPVGNLQEARLANGITNTYNYDNGNRLERIDYSDGTHVTYQYDPNGNLTAITGPGAVGQTAFEYNDIDRLTASTDGYGKRVEYGYDKAGNRTSLTYPDGKVVGYTYDRANHLVDIEDWAGRHTGFTYYGEKLASMDYPNGITCYYGYDAAGRLSSMEYKKTDNSILMALHYTRDENGNPVKVDEEGTLQGTIPPEDTQSTYDSDNRLQTAGTATFLYDANGNTIQRNDGATSESFVYDSANRMVRYKSNDGTMVDHIYDARGYRVARIENGVEVRYILDHGRSMSHVLAETDAFGAITAYYIHGPRLVARIAADGTERYYLTDIIGNVLCLTDDNGEVTDRYLYDPYGIIIAREGLTTNPFTFIGRFGVMQDNQNIYFMRARFYSSGFRRFLSKDPISGPISKPFTLHKYSYAGNSPLSKIDPSGCYYEMSSLSANILNYAILVTKHDAIYLKQNEYERIYPKIQDIDYMGGIVDISKEIMEPAGEFLIKVGTSYVFKGITGGTTIAVSGVILSSAGMVISIYDFETSMIRGAFSYVRKEIDKMAEEHGINVEDNKYTSIEDEYASFFYNQAKSPF